MYFGEAPGNVVPNVLLHEERSVAPELLRRDPKHNDPYQILGLGLHVINI